jgi:hypothetical protein
LRERIWNEFGYQLTHFSSSPALSPADSLSVAIGFATAEVVVGMTKYPVESGFPVLHRIEAV